MDKSIKSGTVSINFRYMMEDKSLGEVLVREQEDTAVKLSEESVSAFLDFLEHRDEYLNTGLGAFHTDGHSNW